MKRAHSKHLNRISILILGTGDSGKTTLRKQLVSVHGARFEKPSYRATFGRIILGNLVDGVLEVLLNLNRLEEVSMLKDSAREVGSYLTPELAEKLHKLIHLDEDFQNAMKTRLGNRIQLQDCFHAFAEELKQYPAWGGLDWIPSTEDCVRSRVRTSGVVTEEVEIRGVEFVLNDVGGQRAERRKWMHSFESCTASIFVTAISEYDQVLFEDRNKNRLQDALELFYECVNSPWLENTTMILFLNKKDLFHQKFSIEKIPLNISGLFPTAPEGNDNEELAIAWFTQLFHSQKVDLKNKPSTIFTHVTTATDPNNVRTVFDVCVNIVLKINMSKAGFVV